MIGTIVRLIRDKGFGFIRDEKGIEHFFHRSGFNGHWDDLARDHNDQTPVHVSFEVERSSKGPRATNVSRLDHPNRGNG